NLAGETTVESAPETPGAADAKPPTIADVTPGEEPQIGTVPDRRSGSAFGSQRTPVRTAPAGQATGAGGGTATAVRTGGRVYCRYCGMESDTADRCSWCHKDLRALPAPRIVEPRHGPSPLK